MSEKPSHTEVSINTKVAKMNKKLVISNLKYACENISCISDIIKHAIFISSVIGVTFGLILLINFAQQENISLQIGAASLVQFSLSIAIMSTGICFLISLLFIIPMVTHWAPEDKVIHAWLSKSLIENSNKKLIKRIKVYTKIHLTSISLYLLASTQPIAAYFLETANNIYVILFLLFPVSCSIIFQWIFIDSILWQKAQENDLPEYSRNPISDTKISDFLNYIFMSIFSSLAWFCIVFLAELLVTGLTLQYNEGIFSQIVIPLFCILLSITLHYMIWWSSSVMGNKIFNLIIIFVLIFLFLILPGGTSITRFVLRYMNIGGGIEVELQLSATELVSISEALGLKIDKANSRPGSIGRVQLILDTGDVLYVRKMPESQNKPAEQKENVKIVENMKTVSIRRISTVAITYYSK